MKLRQILFPAAALLISLQIEAQDLIYKRNGEIVNAKILNTTGKSLSYQLYPPSDSLLYYINFTAIDSIIYRNGEKAAFIKDKTEDSRQRKNPDTDYNHHLIGFDMAELLLYRHLTISYEYLPGKANIGFKATFAKKTGSFLHPPNDFTFYRIPDWTARLGINYYFFRPGTFRLGTGLYYIFGKNTTVNYFYYETSDYQNVKGVILGVFGFYNLNKNLAINLGFDTPLFVNPSTSTLSIAIRCEILFNF